VLRTDRLCHLQGLAQIDPGSSAPALRLGVDAIDSALGGGLACGALHEVGPAQPFHLGAATGFALALASLAQGRQRPVLWIQSAFVRAEAGAPYGVGLDGFGLAMERVLTLELVRVADVLWAAEEALKCRAVAAVIAEIHDNANAVDLIALRRLSLAVRAGGGLGLLLWHRSSADASTAVTRWEVAAAPSLRDSFGGLGRSAFALSLGRNRRGPGGNFLVMWNHHERTFEALSLAVAEAARDRPDRAPLKHAG
jgi:protein ImuA